MRRSLSRTPDLGAGTGPDHDLDEGGNNGAPVRKGRVRTPSMVMPTRKPRMVPSLLDGDLDLEVSPPGPAHRRSGARCGPRSTSPTARGAGPRRTAQRPPGPLRSWRRRHPDVAGDHGRDLAPRILGDQGQHRAHHVREAHRACAWPPCSHPAGIICLLMRPEERRSGTSM